MALNEFKKKIAEYDIPERWYSLNDGLKADALILYKKYSIWEYFYLDEKGNRNDFKIFTHEEDAYEHLWKKLMRTNEIFSRSR